MDGPTTASTRYTSEEPYIPTGPVVLSSYSNGLTLILDGHGGTRSILGSSTSCTSQTVSASSLTGTRQMTSEDCIRHILSVRS